MEFRQLEVGVEVAAAGSFSAAARALHVVQSAVSASVRATEKELGVELFHRRAHGVTLTTAGEAFVTAAREALRAVRHIPQAVSAASGVLRGQLSIGVMHGAWGALDQTLLCMRRDHPEVRVRLRQTSVTEVVTGLQEFRLDLAIVVIPDEPIAGISTREISCEPMVLAASQDFGLAADVATVQEVASLPFIDFSHVWALRAMIDRTFTAAGVSRHSSFEITDINAAAELVRVGLGVTIVPASLARRFFTGLTREVKPSPPPWRVGIAHLDGYVSPAADALIQIVCDAAEDTQARKNTAPST